MGRSHQPEFQSRVSTYLAKEWRQRLDRAKRGTAAELRRLGTQQPTGAFPEPLVSQDGIAYNNATAGISWIPIFGTLIIILPLLFLVYAFFVRRRKSKRRRTALLPRYDGDVLKELPKDFWLEDDAELFQ